ncbi:ras guanine nucleotide exchange factor domain-containing protein [Zopfochytrium polystomum]|nr:ras guanine nucleotide exchange factor domain-containing protein [Zopfochytrium polystomum]
MSCDTPAARAEILVHWIKVANCCLEHLNLNAANAITASLNSASLHRLTRTWAQVPASSLRLLQSLSLLFSPYSNFRVLRSLLANIAATRNSASAGKSPLHRFAVPWFGIYLREIVSLCEVHKIIAPAPSDGHDEVDSQSRNPVLSFDRSWWVSGIVDQALQFQRRPKVISQSVAPLGGAGAAGGGGIPPEWSPWAVPLDAVVGRSRSFRRTAELSPIAEEGSLVGAERADGAAAVAGGRTAPLCDQQDLASYPWPIDLGILRVLAEDMADVDPGHGGTAGGTGGFPAGGSLLRTAGRAVSNVARGRACEEGPARSGPQGVRIARPGASPESSRWGIGKGQREDAERGCVVPSRCRRDGAHSTVNAGCDSGGTQRLGEEARPRMVFVEERLTVSSWETAFHFPLSVFPAVFFYHHTDCPGKSCLMLFVLLNLILLLFFSSRFLFFLSARFCIAIHFHRRSFHPFARFYLCQSPKADECIWFPAGIFLLSLPSAASSRMAVNQRSGVFSSWLSVCLYAENKTEKAEKL